MDEEFDNILKNRIREVFDNFEDSSADEGWQLLREKFPEEQTKRRAFAWLWWGSAAAVLLLFLGIGLLMNNNQHIKPEKLSGSKVKHSQSEHTSLAVTENCYDSSGKSVADGEEKSAVNQTVNKLVATPNLLTDHQKNARPVSDKGPLSDDTAARLTSNLAAVNNKIIANKAPDNPSVAAVPTNPATDKPISPVKTPAKSIDAMFAKDQGAKAKTDEKDKNKKVHFGIYAATYFNYAKGSDNQVNLGGGITSDIKLSRNLKLVTGISVGQNTLNYTTNAPQAILANGDRLARGAGLNNAAANSPAAFAAPTTPPTALKSYNASLVGLDIPVNLKYELNPQKNDIYLSAGLSSGTFINEAYTYRYVYPALPSITQQDATTRTNFNTFYFAKTLDVAFGVGYPFGKNTRLIIEPFLKYPLQSLGSQQIRFGAGGLNLKLNFQPAKK